MQTNQAMIVTVILTALLLVWVLGWGRISEMLFLPMYRAKVKASAFLARHGLGASCSNSPETECELPRDARGRVPGLDLARAMAIICVVTCHATEAGYALHADSFASRGMASQSLAIALYTVGRLGVPIFLMLTGRLLLRRDYDRGRLRLFWRRRWLPLVGCASAWAVTYSLFTCALDGVTPDVGIIARRALLLDSPAMTHWWYMPMIIGMYLLLPIVARGLSGLSPHDLAIPLGVGAAYIFASSDANAIFERVGLPGAYRTVGDGFHGGVYGMYALAGWAIGGGWLRNRSSRALACGGLVSLVACVGLQVWAQGTGTPLRVWYDDGLLAVAATLLFAVAIRWRGVSDRAEGDGRFPTLVDRAVGSLSKSSFGIYLIHAPVLMVTLPWVEGLTLPAPASVAVLFAISLAVAWVVTRMMSMSNALRWLIRG